MKLHSSWLAGALLIFAIFACNDSNDNNSNNSNRNSNINRQSKAQPTRAPNADVYVDRVYMAKEKAGKPGDETTSFDASDRTVYCVINLNKAKKGTSVRLVWKMVDVEGERDKEIRTTDYSTQSFENKVIGHLTLPSDWPEGTYQVEVYSKGSLDKTVDYTIG